jgi:lysozyme
MPDANRHRHLSAMGHVHLRRREGVRDYYYNDVANHCTYGVGTLAHRGPCTAEELRAPVSEEQINKSLMNDVLYSERVVRNAVRHHELTQEQFDAAVSFAYNLPGRTPMVFEPANRGDMASVARNIERCNKITPHDKSGNATGPARVSKGLTNRRREESAPFWKAVK